MPLRLYWIWLFAPPGVPPPEIPSDDVAISVQPVPEELPMRSLFAWAVVVPVPPLDEFRTPASVSVPDEVIGLPEKVSPVELVAATEVTYGSVVEAL